MNRSLWLTLIFFAFAGWSVFSVNYWYCKVCGHCNGSGAQAAEMPSTSTGEPLFLWNSAQPVPDANFPKFKEDLLKRGQSGDTLVITGWYRKEEKTPKGFADMGLFRADSLRKLMMPPLPGDRIRTTSKLVSDNLTLGSAAARSAGFTWNKMVLAMDKGAIIEQDSTVTFLFPFNSTEKDNDPAVEAYLKKLVEKHKDKGANFSVVGHADSIGTDAQNMALAMGRAKSISKVLTGYGFPANRIKVDSKGRNEPVATNSTEDGRHRNRRVVITVME